jgi:hypothetical protein
MTGTVTGDGDGRDSHPGAGPREPDGDAAAGVGATVPELRVGAYTINFALVLLVLGIWVLAGVILTQPDPPVFALTVLGMAICTVVALGFYPSSKSLWCAIDLILAPTRDAQPYVHRRDH